MTTPTVLSPEEKSRVPELAAAVQRVRGELSKRIVGQKEAVDLVLSAVIAEGHCLLVGVPGLAKTLLVSTIAEILSVGFRRIQFTPDLMPSDITGSSVIRDDGTGRRVFDFVHGPIFTNIMLADEINRTPPKTQAALIEAMEERQVSIAGRLTKLPRPFFVLATQNPIEQEGTYPLPVSQLDRFLFEIHVDYPERTDEFDMLVRTTSAYEARVEPCMEPGFLDEILDVARRIEVSSELIEHASRLVRWSRPDQDDSPDFVRESVSWGAGPRATQALLAAARATALMAGRSYVVADDIHAVALPTLRHRIVLRYHASAEGTSADDIVVKLLRALPGGLYREPEPPPAERRGFLARFFAGS